jgi:hypothetical protein
MQRFHAIHYGRMLTSLAYSHVSIP